MSRKKKGRRMNDVTQNPEVSIKDLKELPKVIGTNPDGTPIYEEVKQEEPAPTPDYSGMAQ